MPLAVTPVYAAALAALFILLAARVILYRRGNRVSLGDGGEPELLARIRAHGNCAEYAPFGLLLMLLAELNGTAGLLLHVTGLLLLSGRLAHAAALSSRGRITGRTIGMALTFTSFGLSALLALL